MTTRQPRRRCQRCDAQLPEQRRAGRPRKYCAPCAQVITRETATAWRRARGIPPTTRPASDFTGQTPKPRAFCACGAQASRASSRAADGSPYRCQRCAAVASRGYRTPERPCTHCGKFFRAVKGRRCCSDRCAAARTEEARDRRRVPAERTARLKRARRNRHSARRYADLKRAGSSTRRVVGRWRRICARDRFICWICTGRIDPSIRAPHRRAPSVDHVIPLSAGGSDDDANLRAAHFGCNSRRQS